MNIVYFNAEKFYRLAYDYFRYENNPKMALKYVNSALKCHPGHNKSIILKGQIFLIQNKIKNALNLLLKYYSICPDDIHCLFYIANAYYKDNKPNLALEYLDKILSKNLQDKEFLSECYNLKLNILINLNQYKKAEKLLKTLNYNLFSNDVFDLKENFYKTIQTRKNPGNHSNERILHINF